MEYRFLYQEQRFFNQEQWLFFIWHLIVGFRIIFIRQLIMGLRFLYQEQRFFDQKWRLFDQKFQLVLYQKL